MNPPEATLNARAAARAILAQRRRVETRSAGTTASPKKLTIRTAAALFKAMKTTVHRELTALETTGRPVRQGKAGRLGTLKAAEEAAVIAYMVWMERCGFPAERQLVKEAANLLRSRRPSPTPPVYKK